MFGSRLRADRGFTLVELLVAMLILAILVSIGLASFLGQKVKAQDANAKTAVVTASKAMIAYGTDHPSYDAATSQDLIRIEPSLAQARAFDLSVDGEGRTFVVSVDSASAPNASFTIERTAAGDEIRDCALPGKGACRAEPDEHGDRW